MANSIFGFDVPYDTRVSMRAYSRGVGGSLGGLITFEHFASLAEANARFDELRKSELVARLEWVDHAAQQRVVYGLLD